MSLTKQLAADGLHAEPSGSLSIPGTEVWDVCSGLSGRRYRIMLSCPSEPAPPGGYPVLYMLDANTSFGIGAECIRYQTKKPHGFDPAILVGVGYPPELDAGVERFLDYTTPAELEKLPVRGDGSPWPAIGGAEAFIGFIEEELKPWVEERFTVDRMRQGLMGHSLGGLFALYVLFTRRNSFQTYVAGSPSIWWNDCVLLEKEQSFRRELLEEREATGLTGELKLLIGAGEFEREHQSRMYENADEMGKRLADLEGQGLQTVRMEFTGCGHVSVIPTLISQGIRLALSKTEDERRRKI